MGRASLQPEQDNQLAPPPPDFSQHRKNPRNSNRKFVAAGVIIALAAFTIVLVAMQGSAVYYVSVAEFNSKQSILTAGDKEVRVAGKVVPGTISREDATKTISFVAADKEKPDQTIRVSYSKLPPDTFKDEAEVVVTGTYKNGVFAANEMLAKCPSKYSSQAEQ